MSQGKARSKKNVAWNADGGVWSVECGEPAKNRSERKGQEHGGDAWDGVWESSCGQQAVRGAQ